MESDPSVLERRSALNVQRPETRVDDAVGSGDAAGENQLAALVGKVVVGARVQLWLPRAAVLKRRVRRAILVIDGSGRTDERLLRQHSARDLEREAVGRCLGVGGVD